MHRKLYCVKMSTQRRNKAIVDSRFRSRCTTDAYLLMLIVEQNLAEIDEVVSAVTLLSLKITQRRAHCAKT